MTHLTLLVMSINSFVTKVILRQSVKISKIQNHNISIH
jgi:hypothetical protein